MFVDSLCILFAQSDAADGFSISKEVMILGGTAVFLFLVLAYVFGAALPALKSQLKKKQDELDVATKNADKQHEADDRIINDLKKELEKIRSESSSELESVRSELGGELEKARDERDSKSQTVDSQAAKLAELEGAKCELATATRKVKDLALANHVLGRLSDRLQAESQQEAAGELAVVNEELQKSLCQAKSESEQLASRLRAEQLELHVKKRLQSRLESDAGDLRASLAEQTQAAQSSQAEAASLRRRSRRQAVASKKSQTSQSSSKVRRPLSKNAASANAANCAEAELQTQVRRQSESVINRKMQEAEKQIEDLRRLQERLQSDDSSPAEVLEALTGG